MVITTDKFYPVVKHSFDEQATMMDKKRKRQHLITVNFFHDHFKVPVGQLFKTYPPPSFKFLFVSFYLPGLFCLRRDSAGKHKPKINNR